MSPKIKAVYFKELRDSLRDRRTIFASVFIPLLIWPIMLLGMSEVTQIVQAKMARGIYEVAVPPGTKDFFEKQFQSAENEDLKDIPGLPAKPKLPKSPLGSGDESKAAVPTLKFLELPETDANQQLAVGKLTAVVALSPDFLKRIEARQDAEVEIRFDQAENRSQDARNRLEELFDRYRKSIVRDRLSKEKLTATFVNPFAYKTKNVAQPAKVGGFVMGMFLPLLFIMTLLTGAMHPAIDMTAGEKERSTLETLVGSPIRPLEIITGKFLAVSTLAMGNAALNVASCGASFLMLPMPKTGGFQFPWQALPLTMLLLIPLALFFSALLLAVASFATNSKEAQIFCLPIYFIPLVGMMVVVMPGLDLEGPLLIVPVVNTAMLIKELFLSHGTAQQVVYVFVSTCMYAAGAVALAGRVFAREEVLFSAQGSLRLFLSRRFFKPFGEPKTGDSLLIVAILFPLNFYFQLWLSKVMLEPGESMSRLQFTLLVALPLYLLFLGVPIAIALYLKLDLKRTFQWRWPPLRAMLGALCLGAGSWLLASEFVSWQSRMWEFTSSDMSFLDKAMHEMTSSSAGIALLIFLIGVTPGLCEEHLFRGFLQQGLRGWGKWPSLLAVGAIFAAYHFPLFRQPVVFVLGVTLAYVAYESRSIWPGVFFHFLHNSLSALGGPLLGMKMEQPAPGQPLPGVPLEFLLPAIVLFAAGLALVKGSGNPLPKRLPVKIDSSGSAPQTPEAVSP